jgi:hypothetical protein
MSTTAVCPSCSATQPDSLLCSSCTQTLTTDLRGNAVHMGVAELVDQLDILTSKQARIGETSGAPGLARERSPLNWKGVQGTDDLASALVYWARQVSGLPVGIFTRRPATTAARVLLANIDTIRRYHNVEELIEGITHAIHDARRTIDRYADLQFLGTCLAPYLNEEDQERTCTEEVYASHGASHTTCKSCGVTHAVPERRAWLMNEARDIIATVKEASRYLGEIGDIRVTESSIRGYIHRGKLSYRPGTLHGIRIGDLLDVVVDEGKKRVAS